MKKTTLCYLEKDGCYLMLLRNKKKQDYNEGKWIGVGGKCEPGEAPDDCVRREVLEETGITLNSMHFYGVIEFRSDVDGDEDMYLYSSDGFSFGSDVASDSSGEQEELLPGEAAFVPECNEGTLRWIQKGDILSLNLWEGDRYFLKDMLEGKKEINLRLTYVGRRLTEVKEI